MGALTLQVQPVTEPVSLVNAKEHIRVDITDDDVFITALAEACKDKVEDLTGRRLITQTWKWTFDRFPVWDFLLIPLAPVISIDSITTFDKLDNSTLFPAASYFSDVVSEPSRIVLKEGAVWPVDNELREANGVEVVFKVGYGPADTDVPKNLTLAQKLLIGHFYENREVTSPIIIHEVPLTVTLLLSRYKAWNQYHHAEVSPSAQSR